MKYLDAFVDEATDILQTLDRTLTRLEQTPGLPALLDELYRSAHTLKASAQTMGYQRFAGLAHDMEGLISDAREGRLISENKLTNLISQCLDRFSDYMRNITEDGREGEVDSGPLQDEMTGLRSSDPDAAISGERLYMAGGGFDAAGKEKAIRDALKTGRRLNKFKVVIRKDCGMKAARAFLDIQAMEKLGTLVYSEPDIQDILDDRFGYEFTAYLLNDEGAGPYKKLAAGLAETESFDVEDIFTNAHAAPDTNANRPERAAPSRVRIADGPKNAPAGRQIDFQDKSIRINVSDIYELQRHTSDFSRSFDDLTGLLSDRLPGLLDDLLKRLADAKAGIEHSVFIFRTSPLSETFARLPQICADLALELDKKVEFKITSGDTRCDIDVVTKLTQSLMHILRNSIDHGIESPEVRTAHGKPEKGSVLVNAFYSSDDLTIEISDDGAGVNVEKTRKKAVAAGILTGEEAREASAGELIRLVFLPAFTTRDEVSLYSGRGVGLDVVKARIEEIGGSADIESEEGRGTKITLKLPRYINT